MGLQKMRRIVILALVGIADDSVVSHRSSTPTISRLHFQLNLQLSELYWGQTHPGHMSLCLVIASMDIGHSQKLVDANDAGEVAVIRLRS